MVNIVEEWKDMERYSSQVSNGAYKLVGVEGKAEIRVKLGQFGFIKVFDDPNDPHLSEILTFCKTRGYLNVSKTIKDEFFFK
ncbi:hypothetical protein MUO79_03250 [Candidatus Bathyarchaeota archaeon]|nr:hypothetical protein [Candidatus Bathyarchaeota archaeon]